MAKSIVVDAGFIVALLHRRDFHHGWAVSQARHYPPTWHTCEAVLSEAFHLLGKPGLSSLSALVRRQALMVSFGLVDHLTPVLALLRKYANLPMSFADACLVRMTETLPDPLLLTTDGDFQIYRRHGRQVVPCVMP
jgi:predicted nucleic acid-binding protein